LKPLFESLSESHLQWLPELGIGWYPVTEAPYDAAYWARYRRQDATETGAALTRARCALVSRHLMGRPGTVVDIGIGGGRFVEASGARGFDINPAAIDWLQTNDRWFDPYSAPFHAATFWDSLEHIHDPAPLLANVRGVAFVSLPIFSGPEHIVRSKHFRKDEHCWYFTRAGFIDFMDRHGFRMLEVNVMEQHCGREDIESYAFARRI